MWHWLLTLHGLGLLLAAVFFRCWMLGNIPGCNGDEAWYGTQVWRWLHGGPACWFTPTGNPCNVFYLFPLMLLHVCLPPSFVVLRSVAVFSGLAALAINWFLCRWVFDRRTAAVSTIVLAILPVDIVFSRFAWDASQSLAATLLVVYPALAAVRFPQYRKRCVALAVAAQWIAIWVHPTNVFVGMTLVAVFIIRRSQGIGGAKRADANDAARSPSMRRVRWYGGIITVLFVACGIWAVSSYDIPLWRQIERRRSDLWELIHPTELPPFSVLYARLFSGGTVYRDIAGSHSWFEWPLPDDREGGGIDVGAFWAAILAAGWLTWRSSRHGGRREDGALMLGWVLTLAVFLVVAGPRAMTVGYERFSLCLVGLTALLLSRGVILAWEAASPRWQTVLALGSLAGWLVLADFHEHYFRFIERTGGEAHYTFRTAPKEPKEAAVQYIAQQCGDREAWIVCSQWWNYWPVSYLAGAHPNLHVRFTEPLDAPEFCRIPSEGDLWFIEFADTEPLAQLESRLGDRRIDRHEIADYAGRPLLSILHPLQEASP
jgi:hypothetical protein